MEAVKEAASWLDSVVPDWFEQIDSRTLDLGDPWRCVLGQVAYKFPPIPPRKRHWWSRKAKEVPLMFSTILACYDLLEKPYGRAFFPGAGVREAWVREVVRRRTAALAMYAVIHEAETALRRSPCRT